MTHSVPCPGKLVPARTTLSHSCRYINPCFTTQNKYLVDYAEAKEYDATREARRKGICGVPIISMFYGIVVMMFFEDDGRHKKPHIHVEYQEHEAVFSIPDGKLLRGSLPPARRFSGLSP